MSRKVSFVMPVRDEANHLAAAIESVLHQRLPAGWQSELIVALAPSRDSSEQILRQFEAKTPAGWLKVLANTAGDAANGLNLAISESRGEVVIRVDGHSRLPGNYTSLGIEALERDARLGNVGGMMIAVGDSPLQRAIAWAYGSRWGLGGGKFHVGGDAGEADTVYLGIFRREALKIVGGFDASFVRGQDWELNQRIRDAGYLVWFDPRLRVEYRPRDSLASLRKQFFDTGAWRGVLTRRLRGRTQLRYFAPPALVVTSLLIIPAAVYLMTVLLVSLFAKVDVATRFRLLMVLPAMHYSWGLGFLRGWLFGFGTKPS